MMHVMKCTAFGTYSFRNFNVRHIETLIYIYHDVFLQCWMQIQPKLRVYVAETVALSFQDCEGREEEMRGAREERVLQD